MSLFPVEVLFGVRET